MTQQLTLLDLETDWKINDATKAIGRKGIAEARALLESFKASDNFPIHATAA